MAFRTDNGEKMKKAPVAVFLIAALFAACSSSENNTARQPGDLGDGDGAAGTESTPESNLAKCPNAASGNVTSADIPQGKCADTSSCKFTVRDPCPFGPEGTFGNSFVYECACTGNWACAITSQGKSGYCPGSE